MQAAEPMNDKLADEYAELLRRYSELADGIRLIRRATERACRAGVLPAIEDAGRSPKQECEAIARAIYQATLTSTRYEDAPLAGLDPDNSPT